MSPGWPERFFIERTIKKIIARIIRNIDRTLRESPHLTVEDALKIMDKRTGIFFPGEPDTRTDLKSLFTLLVWKSYRYKRLSDPRASSREHRDFIAKIVDNYLNQENLKAADASRPSKPVAEMPVRQTPRPALLSIGIGVAVLFLGGLVFFSSERQTGFTASAPKQYLVSPQINHFRYSGYSTDDHKKAALINETIRHEGDPLDDHHRYVLKSIHPRHIVIQNKIDKSEFSVMLQ